MSIPASFGVTDSTERRRFAARRKLRLQSKLTSGVGLGHSVEVLNLSSSGMLLKTAHKLKPSETILVHIDSGVQRAATIMWSSAPLYGCRFDEPLSKGQLSAAVLRSTNEPTPLLSNRPPAGTSNWADKEIGGSDLARMRKATGMTQADLASRIGVSKTTVWKWENGAAIPRRMMAARLAQLLADTLPAGDLATDIVEVISSQREETAQGDELEAVVSRCKRQIAQAVGTSIDRITIQIQF